MGKRVLLVDDDEKLRRLLKEYLEGYEFQVFTLADGEAVLKSIKKESPEIVILDIMLPKKDGLEVLKEIRAVSRVPVIMLTAKGEEADRVVGLELGADDYLPKPFSPRELLARMKAVLRRLDPGVKPTTAESEELRVEAGNLVLDKARQILLMGGKEVSLSSTEYRVLRVLMENPNRVLSRDQIMTLAQGKDFMAFDRSIDVHISKLRAKLESDPRSPKRIKTIWGSGYMFVHST
ncbi:MAG: two-component system response regulator OmpR [Deltaproteobacteria bacterium RBG_13_53_10]|nr:MAG: two-component system response regulator OmpR [Deltaproteobacteria bacterium RBG_13_53_10]